MREIKFRAWDENAQKMLVWEEIEAWDIVGYILSEARYIPMQHTGLKDKGGKKIYEGDVVEYDCRGERLRGDVWFNGYLWEIREFYNIAYDWPGDAFSEGTKKLELKIIGNIYENPELSNTVDSGE